MCREFGIHIGRLTLAFLILSSGMYIASSAFLPSSFAMYVYENLHKFINNIFKRLILYTLLHRYLSTLATAAWYGRQYELAIFATAISALLGWPFAALLGYYLYV